MAVLDNTDKNAIMRCFRGSYARVWCVNKSGNDINGGQNPDDAFLTFTAACTAATSSGITSQCIIVGPGTYAHTTSQPDIPAQCDVFGASAAATQITGTLGSATAFGTESVLLVNGNNLIQDITIRNVNSTSNRYAPCIHSNGGITRFKNVRMTAKGYPIWQSTLCDFYLDDCRLESDVYGHWNDFDVRTFAKRTQFIATGPSTITGLTTTARGYYSNGGYDILEDCLCNAIQTAGTATTGLYLGFSASGYNKGWIRGTTIAAMETAAGTGNVKNVIESGYVADFQDSKQVDSLLLVAQANARSNR